MPIANDLVLWHAPALAGLVVGMYLTHELLHVLPLAIGGARWDIEVFPGESPWWYSALLGRAVAVETDAPPALAVLSLLAPSVLAVPGLAVWALMLRALANGGLVRLSWLLVVALWVIVLLPSPIDWMESWRVVRGRAEVSG